MGSPVFAARLIIKPRFRRCVFSARHIIGSSRIFILPVRFVCFCDVRRVSARLAHFVRKLMSPCSGSQPALECALASCFDCG